MKSLVIEATRVDSVRHADPAVGSVAGERYDGPSASAFSGVFEAIGALHNRRAFIALLGGLLIGALLNGFLATLGGHSSGFLSFVGGLSFFVAGTTGVNAAGVLLMAQARGTASRGLQGAIVEGLMCVPKCIVLGLALLLVALVVLVALMGAYFVCKLPLLGPMLFVLIFPLSVVVGGLSFGGLSLCLFLALPALWEGAGLSTAIAQVLAIARSRLIEAFLLMASVGLLTAAVGGVVFGVLLAGLLPMLALSATIFGAEALSGLAALLPAFAGTAPVATVAVGGVGGADQQVAIALGAGLLSSFAGSLVCLVPLLGLNLVYLRVSEGLELGRAKPATAAVGFAPRPTALDQAPPTRRRPAVAPSALSDDELTTPFALRNRCSHCLSTIAADDIFCGICGYKLG